MNENFLHFLWRWRRFDGRDLQTTDGQTLEILQPGEPNSHAGPDFFNARLRIGEQEWAGNVEMHVKASEWLAHRHDSDRAYDNVVLHVVLEEDQKIQRSQASEPLPCLELRNRIPPKLLENYLRLEHERAFVPCAHFFGEVPEIVRLNWFDRLLVARLEQKTETIAAELSETGNHWEAVFYRALARNFGLKINAEPFAALARSLPVSVLGKHKNSLFQIEALLFGQAGLLAENFGEDYPAALAKEHSFLRQKFDLQPIAGSQWKFLRLRPANFPSVRIAQFAALVCQSTHLFSKILEAKNLRELENLFAAEPSEYWLTHYRFDKTSAKRSKFAGKDFAHLLAINTVAPFLFHYGKTKKLPAFSDRALALLEEIPPESNAILEGWENLGLKPRNAAQTQALIELKTKFCDPKRCLDCAIGNSILK